jgi:glyoxylase-like metal-dependent hydrolase (beta-lactamase superfamily II)
VQRPKPPEISIPFLGYDPESYQRAPVQPTRLVSEGDVVETGDGEFQVLHLPGHSPGSIALWERSSGLLFSGDAIYDGIVVDNLPGSDVQSYRATMKRIEELPVAQVFGGHNAPMTRTHMLDVVSTYLASRPRAADDTTRRNRVFVVCLPISRSCSLGISCGKRSLP